MSCGAGPNLSQATAAAQGAPSPQQSAAVGSTTLQIRHYLPFSRRLSAMLAITVPSARARVGVALLLASSSRKLSSQDTAFSILDQPLPASAFDSAQSGSLGRTCLRPRWGG